MMVLTLQSNADENENSQGRQLPVSKKLSKAIGSVNRSRFSKPRPNLLSSKRGDSNASSNTANRSETSRKSNSVETTLLNAKDTSQNIEDNNVAVLSKKDALQKIEDKTADVLVKKDALQKIEDNSADVPVKKDALQKIEDKSADVPVKKCTSENVDNNVALLVEKDTSQNIEDNNVSVLVVEKQTSQDVEDNTGVLVEKQTSQNVEDHDVAVLVENKTAKKVKSSSSMVINTDETLNEQNVSESVLSSVSDVIIQSENEVCTPDSNSVKTSQEIVAVISSSPNKDKTSKEIAPVVSANLNKESIQSFSLLEKIMGATNIPSSISDKSSKYPHLTSILSKKRSEPKRETQQKRRRKFKKDAAPERSKMTMADLIYWNPANAEKSQKSNVAPEEVSNSNIAIEEECVDDNVVEENAMQESVPKLVITEDGQINVDQSSLFVSRNLPQVTVTEVRKDDTTYSSFRKRPLTKHWDTKDTTKFYKALSLVGSDFSLMEQIFPNRTRRELKQKFKREEKYNIDLINRALYESHTFDEDTLNNFMVEEVDNDSADTVNDSEAPVKVKKSGRKKKTAKENTDVQSDSISDLNVSVPVLTGSIPDLSDLGSELNDSVTERTAGENVKIKDENKKRRKRVKKSPKTNDDDEVPVSKSINCDDIIEREGSKRRRNVKKLPDDFVYIDSIEEAEFNDVVNYDIMDIQEKLTEESEDTLHEATQDLSETENANIINVTLNEATADLSETENVNIINVTLNEATTDLSEAENANIIEVTLNKTTQDLSETENADLIKVISVEDAGNNEVELSYKGNDDLIKIADPQPVILVGTDDEEECVTIDIKNVNTDSNLTLLTNVMAYEVVNTQAPIAKKRRKVNPSIVPRKTQQNLVSSHLSSANYTHFTPV